MSDTTRRKALADVALPPREAASHPGLWFDRFLTNHETGSKAVLVDQVAAIAEPPLYRQHYERWQRALAKLGARTRTARMVGRVAVGLGNETVIETGIALHRTYGMPYLPGSALKGLAAAYARQRLDPAVWARDAGRDGPTAAGETPPPNAYTTLFGDVAQAGYVTFFDALYVPGSGANRQALHPDVITVHHPGYYQGSDPPADWDSPNPVSFLSATGQYLLAVAGPPRWAAAALDLLALALAELGVGAKTSSGYGRAEVERPATRVDAPDGPAGQAAPSADPLARGTVYPGRVESVTSGNRALIALSGLPPALAGKVKGAFTIPSGQARRYRAGTDLRVRVVEKLHVQQGVQLVQVEPVAEGAE